MKVLAALIAAAAMPACAPSSPTAKLSDLRDAQLSGTDTGFGFSNATSANCPELSSDVHGTIDGAPLIIHTGGLVSAPDSNYCASIEIAFPSALANNAVTSIELSDGDTSWRFGVERLAPSQWTVTAPSDAVEGSDVTVGFAPTPPGVELEDVTITPSKIYISPFTGQPAPGTNTVHIDAGYWSSKGEPGTGQPVPGTLAIDLGGLTVDGCPVASCSFTTRTPVPELPITIVTK